MKTKSLMMMIVVPSLIFTGCLKKDEAVGPADVDPAALEPVAINPEASLLETMDANALSLVSAVNEVAIEGDLLKEVPMEEPPQPLPVEGDEGVKKGLGYLLSNAQKDQSGLIVTYSPDPRFCSKVVAKNNPQVCIEALKRVKIVQQAKAPKSGRVQILFDAISPFQFEYAEKKLEMSVSLADVRLVMTEVRKIEEQIEGPQMGGDGPEVMSGKARLTLEKLSSDEVALSFSVDEAIHLSGKDESEREIMIQAAEKQSIIRVMLNKAEKVASLEADLPAASASFWINDENMLPQNARITFPGASGKLTFSNSLKSIVASGVKLLGPKALFHVGERKALDVSFSPIEAELKILAGSPSLRALAAMNARVEIDIIPAALEKTGVLSVSVADQTRIEWPSGADYAQVVEGEFLLSGTGDFEALLQVQAGSCVQGNVEAALMMAQVSCAL